MIVLSEPRWISLSQSELFIPGMMRNSRQIAPASLSEVLTVIPDRSVTKRNGRLLKQLIRVQLEEELPQSYFFRCRR